MYYPSKMLGDLKEKKKDIQKYNTNKQKIFKYRHFVCVYKRKERYLEGEWYSGRIQTRKKKKSGSHAI